MGARANAGRETWPEGTHRMKSDLTTSHGTIPAGSKVLQTRPIPQGAAHGPGSEALVKIGVYWSVSEFFAKALKVPHPFAAPLVDDHVGAATFKILTEGPESIQRQRENLMASWTLKAADLSKLDDALITNLHLDVQLELRHPQRFAGDHYLYKNSKLVSGTSSQSHDGYPDFNLNATSETKEAIDTEGVNTIVAMAKAWATMVKKDGTVVFTDSTGFTSRAPVIPLCSLCPPGSCWPRWSTWRERTNSYRKIRLRRRCPSLQFSKTWAP